MLDEKINYDFLNEKKTLLKSEIEEASIFLQDLENIIKDHKCKGCGIELQCTKKEKLGYVPEKKVKDFLGESETKENNQKNKFEDLNLENFEIPKDTDYIKRLNRKKLKKTDLICERCFKLQKYIRLNENGNQAQADSDKNQDKLKLDNYSLLIKKIDSQKLIQQILVRLSSKSHIFYLCVI